jgi:hypothetical protein
MTRIPSVGGDQETVSDFLVQLEAWESAIKFLSVEGKNHNRLQQQHYWDGLAGRRMPRMNDQHESGGMR